MLGSRLRTLLPERGISINDFAEMCDLPIETVKSIYYGKTTDAKLSTAIKMADALHLSLNCLVGKCEHSPAERGIIENYRKCGKHGRSVIELVARYEAGAIKADRNRIGNHKIPCILPTGNLHNGILYDLCENTEIETSSPDAYIAIQMTNNDFVPVYCKGDIILFENRFPQHAEYAAFLIADRIYIRKYLEEEKTYRLQCLHRHGEDIVLKRMDEADYIGTIIGVVRE